MKRILLCLFISCGFIVKAQVYNNEWIDFSKTYYKCKVGKTGVYRIAQSTLTGAGLGSAQAQDLQLWRNGVQIPIYTTIASGNLSASDYIEFWGEMNDGKPDKALYKDPDYQLNDKWNLLSDTAIYFLTVNPGGNNLRLSVMPNNVSANSLLPEPYFMYTLGKYFQDRIQDGYAVNVDNQYLRSSAYDKGEGWASNAFIGTHSLNFTDLQVYNNGPSASFNIGVSGDAISTRTYTVKINNDSITGGPLDFFNYAKSTGVFPSSILSSNTAQVDVIDAGARMIIHKYEITYPRIFNFSNKSNFEFQLPANGNNSYLEISNFAFGTAAPVLYDLTNGQRYIADITAAPLVRIVLQPSATERKLVLVSEEASNINFIGGFTQRVFTNYSVAANQANYLIISNALLLNGPNGTNPLEDYRAYRASAQGGAFNAKVYFIDELTDQFAFGIKKHPLGVRNFIRFARHKFGVNPSYVFLIGKGGTYTMQRFLESDPNSEKLNLVPTWGWPASDILLSAEPGSSIPETPIGRLSVIYPQEITAYLNKIKESEQAQVTLSPNFGDRGWMKNVIHLNGGGAPALNAIITSSFEDYKKIISDTLYGANVLTFTKQSVSAVETLGTSFKKSFEEGVSLVTYFGHSSSGTLSYSLDEPQAYNNQGKYPSFIALGCSAGEIFDINGTRFTKLESISEKYVLAPERGVINFLASSHFGIVHYLKIWNERMYKNISNIAYGKSIGEAVKLTAIDVFNYTGQDDFYSRANVEELILHGDPAVKINPHAKADYLVTDQLVRISPDFISIAEHSFKVNAQFFNIGKAENKKIVIEIKRQFPDGSIKTAYRDTINGIRYSYTINVDIPIDIEKDKGANKLIVTIDADNNVDEFYESNNSITKEFLIYEDEARPIYPYNFGIANQPNIKLVFSTANPLSQTKQYKVEVDTTELFNSSTKISKIVNSIGGIVEVDPGFNLINKTVYYWRVAIVPANGEYKWNSSSFVYLQNHDPGFNQSHLYQHFKSTMHAIYLDSTSRVWKHPPLEFNTELMARIGTFPYATEQLQNVAINGSGDIRSTCWFSSLVFNVFDASTNQPWVNQTITNANWPVNVGEGLYGSAANNCNPGRQNNFEFRYFDTADRRKMMDFMRDIVPDGAYVMVRNMTLEDYWGRPQAYASDWAADTSIHGSGKSLYHYLKNAGFAEIDSFNRVRQWAFIYKKNDPSFTPQSVMTAGERDFTSLSVSLTGLQTNGIITSPVFGPSNKWKQLLWNGASMETPTGDNPRVDIIGIKKDNSTSVLFNNIGLNQKSFDISSIDAKQFPNLQLRMYNSDSTQYTPYQLDYWRLTGEPAPEGAVAPNLFFKMADTLEAGQPIDFKLAFRNVTPFSFDSLKVKIVVTDQNNVQHILPVARHRPLAGNDTIHIRHFIDTRQFSGLNNIFIEVNPDNDQPEQYHFNNFVYSKFFVRNDSLNPLLDVTFDNVHILNNDLVSARPDIMIKLKDESKWLLLSDTSLVTVKVRYPNGAVRDFSFTSDTLRFTSAQSSSDNTATINFKPFFTDDGTYELIVSGKDGSNNDAGTIEYKVAFQVINKAMISNMLNYPNPFTTSTAFVFTITGSEVPQNIKIQILTITGKVVREITKDELGLLHIGRNITEYKWNGTDQYGQKLANGVYLYRIVTNLNGKSLDRYTSEKDDTDKYFNKGYGKMYLMR
jgi:hypothetical protein